MPVSLAGSRPTVVPSRQQPTRQGYGQDNSSFLALLQMMMMEQAQQRNEALAGERLALEREESEGLRELKARGLGFEERLTTLQEGQTEFQEEQTALGNKRLNIERYERLAADGFQRDIEPLGREAQAILHKLDQRLLDDALRGEYGASSLLREVARFAASPSTMKQRAIRFAQDLPNRTEARIEKFNNPLEAAAYVDQVQGVLAGISEIYADDETTIEKLWDVSTALEPTFAAYGGRGQQFAADIRFRAEQELTTRFEKLVSGVNQERERLRIRVDEEGVLSSSAYGELRNASRKAKQSFSYPTVGELHKNLVPEVSRFERMKEWGSPSPTSDIAIGRVRERQRGEMQERRGEVLERGEEVYGPDGILGEALANLSEGSILSGLGGLAEGVYKGTSVGLPLIPPIVNEAVRGAARSLPGVPGMERLVRQMTRSGTPSESALVIPSEAGASMDGMSGVLNESAPQTDDDFLNLLLENERRARMRNRGLIDVLDAGDVY